MVPKRILVADDEAHIQCVVATRLREAGFAVITADDGQQAYELACKELPHLIVADYQMPRLSGLELAARLRNNPHTAQTPIILMTVEGLDVSVMESSKAALAAVLVKPFSPRDVVGKVSELIARSAA